MVVLSSCGEPGVDREAAGRYAVPLHLSEFVKVLLAWTGSVELAESLKSGLIGLSRLGGEAQGLLRWLMVPLDVAELSSFEALELDRETVLRLG